MTPLPPPVIRQGESGDFAVYLVDQKGNPIDLTDVVGIEAETRIANILSRKYSNAESLPPDNYTITVTLPNKISVFISRADSLNYNPDSKQVLLNVLIKNPEGGTPLYYSQQYVIATTALGYLLNSSL